jgi:hypothetical protein
MANPIATVINLNGAWTSGGVIGPLISVSGNAISVDMSAYQRPFAAGSVLGSSNITVTFGDDNTYTATLIPGIASTDTIQWSNGTAWTRAIPLLTTSLIDLNGQWVSAGTTEPVINVAVSGRLISIDMPAGRPNARGYIFDFADIFVDFPEDAGLTARLELPNTIHWSNTSIWQKLIILPPSITMVWEVGGTIKTLFVSGTNFPPGLVTIVVDSGHDGTFHFTGFAGANGTFTANQAISCTSNNTLHISVFEGSNTTTPVITTSTLCPQTPV